MLTRKSILSTGLASLLFASTALGGQLLTVDSDGSQMFTSIQAAVDFAADGDTILIHSGFYDAFVIDGKELNVRSFVGALIFAGTTAPSAVTIQNLPAGKQVVIQGLRPRAVDTSNFAAVHVRDCDGSVWFQDVNARSYTKTFQLDAAKDVVMDRVEARHTYTSPDTVGSNPVIGLENGSSLFAFDSEVWTSKSFLPMSTAIAGGDALRVRDSQVWFDGGSLQSAGGGEFDVAGCQVGTSNGALVRAEDTAAPGAPSVVLTGVVDKFYGQPGSSDLGCAAAPQAVPPYVGTAAQIQVMPTPNRRVFMNAYSKEGYPISLHGDADAGVLVFASLDVAAPLEIPGFHGAVLLDLTQAVRIFAGTMPAATDVEAGIGVSDLEFSAPAIPAGLAPGTLHVQAAFIDAMGAVALSNGRTLQL